MILKLFGGSFVELKNPHTQTFDKKTIKPKMLEVYLEREK